MQVIFVKHNGTPIIVVEPMPHDFIGLVGDHYFHIGPTPIPPRKPRFWTTLDERPVQLMADPSWAE